MSKTKQTVAVGVFETRSEADQAVERLHQAGFLPNQIGVAARNSDGTKKTTTTTSEAEKVGGGATAGIVAGAGIGGLIGLGVLAGVIPVIGPAIAAGTLGVILSNAAGGAAIAGLSGALIGWGMSKEDATYYDEEMKAGRYVVTVHADERNGEAWKIMQQNGATNREFPRANSSTSSTSKARVSRAARNTSGEATLKVHEERLHAHKEPVDAGEVRVRKEVTIEHQTIDVPVEREEVVIERRPASGRASSSDIQPGEEIRIPVKEEQVRVEKETVMKEEVHVGKRKVLETKQVSGDVRKEEVKIDQKGKVDVRNKSK